MKRQRREVFPLADKIAIRGRATDGGGRVFCEKCRGPDLLAQGLRISSHLIPEGMRPLADLTARSSAPRTGPSGASNAMVKRRRTTLPTSPKPKGASGSNRSSLRANLKSQGGSDNEDACAHRRPCCSQPGARMPPLQPLGLSMATTTVQHRHRGAYDTRSGSFLVRRVRIALLPEPVADPDHERVLVGPEKAENTSRPAGGRFLSEQAMRFRS